MRKIMNHLMTVLVIVLAVYLIRTFVLMPISIDGDSMEPTLHNQDFLMMERLSYYFDEPERFDIVVFHATKQKDYIKRIIGLPGETIEYKGNQLYINGSEKKEYFLTDLNEYTNDFTINDIEPGRDQIPEGYYLVLGDNRNNSTDSRTIGLVPKDKIIGRAFLRYWPLDDFNLVR
ncbi:signal peptidase I [Halolactibacillus halophilus]|uniref:Signal peptidase I n=2 Tax=Halolactibacillus halophilus TaxID=306540 RepID=A0A1I5LMM0_9BACI|nr:signal peptidase I [Halolactibacillus halophilus]SFO98465.1 signal peptidase I [Halolactibacillus halophilus]